MRIPHLLPLVAALALLVCDGGAAQSSAGLAYGVPSSPDVIYLVADTLRVDIDAMGQVMTSSRITGGTYATRFVGTADGLSVTLSVTDFAGSMSQPVGPIMRAEESDITGPLVLTLDPTGNVTIVSEPALSGGASQVFGALTLAHTFFPGLPSGAVSEGTTWVDTIRYAGPEGPAEVSAFSIFEYLATGDTVLDGRTLLKIEVLGTTELESSGSVEGTSFFQSALAGVAGLVLWDRQRGLMVERTLAIEGEGMIEASVVPAPLPITLRASSRIWLQQ